MGGRVGLRAIIVGVANAPLIAYRAAHQTPTDPHSESGGRQGQRCVCVCVLVAWVGAGAVVGGLAVQQAGRTERCKLQEREGATAEQQNSD